MALIGKYQTLVGVEEARCHAGKVQSQRLCFAASMSYLLSFLPWFGHVVVTRAYLLAPVVRLMVSAPVYNPRKYLPVHIYLRQAVAARWLT